MRRRGRGRSGGLTVAAVVVVAGLLGCNGRDEGGPRDAPASASVPSPPPVATPPKRRGPPVRKDGTVFVESELMGTRISINVWVGDKERAAEAGDAMTAAVDEMARLEQILSEWRPDSDVSRLSDAAGGPMQVVAPELYEILARSREIAEDTRGAFDPTFHAVGQLWSFRPGAVPPSPEAIAAKLPLIGWEKLELDPARKAVRLSTAGMRIGLGAIGKGFAADKASAVLVAAGFPNHVVEVGGDTYAAGKKDGKPWMVGIQRPDGPGALGAIPSSDEAVVTSGDYQRYFEFEGKRYAHILDPRTGWPVPAERSPKSVTMVARTGTDADAYCTAVAVMGVDEGLTFVEAHDGLEVVIVTQDDELRVSSGLRSRLVLPPSPPTPKATDGDGDGGAPTEAPAGDEPPSGRTTLETP